MRVFRPAGYPLRGLHLFFETKELGSDRGVQARLLGHVSMRSKYTYRLVPPNSPEMEALTQFAKSFDHHIVLHPKINVYAHYRDEVLFGYSDHEFIPTVYPAFHPMFTKPKDVIQVLSDWRAHSQFACSPSHIGVPLESESGRINFPLSVMEKLGLNRLNRELFGISC